MKTSSLSFRRPALPMGLILALVVSPLGTAPARAENPFKIIGAKAKQGFVKVTRAVSPRRVGSAIQQVKYTAVRGKDKVREQLIEAPTAYFRGEEAVHANRTGSYQTTTYVYPESSTAPSSHTVSFGAGSRVVGRDSQLDSRGVHAIPQSDYYTSARYLSAPSTLKPNAGPAVASNPGLPRVYPTPTSLQARLKPDPDPANSPSLTAGEPEPGTSSTSAPNPASSNQTTSPTPPPVPREDLPFGLLLPGKEGMVYSPYRDKQMVDVSGIPTGTKVKCPYTGKTFRVP